MSTVVQDRWDGVCEPIEVLRRHRALTWELTKREITDRYAGQIFGTLWAVGHPLVMMGVYVFVFAVVLKTKVGGGQAMPHDYTVYLLSGLIPWLAFQEAMSKAGTVIKSHANLVKQVVFPVEILPVKGILAAMITQLIASALLAIYTFASSGTLPWTWSLVPLLWVCQFMAMAGVCYILASVGTYFRDVKDFVQIFCTAGVYAMPVFYLPEWVPDMMKPLIWLNPFSYLGWCFQDACYFGRIEHPWAWIVFCGGSPFLFLIGYRVFRHLRVCFGSVL